MAFVAPQQPPGLRAIYARGGDDAEAARIEACFPEGDVLAHAVLRAERSQQTRSRGLSFHRDGPAPLEANRVLGAWRRGGAEEVREAVELVLGGGGRQSAP